MHSHSSVRRAVREALVGGLHGEWRFLTRSYVDGWDGWFLVQIQIPNGIALRTLSWNQAHGWIACGGEGGLVKVLKLDAVPAKEIAARGLAATSNLSMNQALEGHAGALRVSCVCEGCLVGFLLSWPHIVPEGGGRSCGFYGEIEDAEADPHSLDRLSRDQSMDNQLTHRCRWFALVRRGG